MLVPEAVCDNHGMSALIRQGIVRGRGSNGSEHPCGFHRRLLHITRTALRFSEFHPGV